MKQQYIKNVATLELFDDKCTGCGVCVTVCPHEVFKMYENKAMIVNKDRCMECGACANNCAFDAIAVDANVGCAYAIIRGMITNTEPSCGCSDDEASCC